MKNSLEGTFNLIKRYFLEEKCAFDLFVVVISF